MTTTQQNSSERADLLDAIQQNRDLYLQTMDGLSDEQAGARSTVSELTLGGLLKHVTAMEANWMRFIREGAGAEEPLDWEAVDWSDPPPQVLERMAEFEMGEATLADLVAAYRAGAQDADALLADLPDLDVSHELPPAPWFPPGTRWSARRVFAHMLAETARHAGHADILREAIDGQKTMG